MYSEGNSGKTYLFMYSYQCKSLCHCDEVQYHAHGFILTVSTPAVNRKMMTVSVTAKIITAFCVSDISAM